jgi:hypothetical protein
MGSRHAGTAVQTLLRHAGSATVLDDHPTLVPMVIAQGRGTGVSWNEAVLLACAMGEGFRLVRELGNTITPASIVLLSRVPAPMAAGSLWAFTRLKRLSKLLAWRRTKSPAY